MNLYSKMLLTAAILVASISIAQERFHPPAGKLTNKSLFSGIAGRPAVLRYASRGHCI
jgi:hypothetical protein